MSPYRIFFQLFAWENPYLVFPDGERDDLTDEATFYLELFDAVGGGFLCR